MTSARGRGSGRKLQIFVRVTHKSLRGRRVEPRERTFITEKSHRWTQLIAVHHYVFIGLSTDLNMNSSMAHFERCCNSIAKITRFLLIMLC